MGSEGSGFAVESEALFGLFNNKNKGVAKMPFGCCALRDSPELTVPLCFTTSSVIEASRYRGFT